MCTKIMEEFKIDDFKIGFKSYLTEMKNQGELLNGPVQKMKSKLRLVVHLSKNEPAKDEEEDYILRSSSDDSSGGEMNQGLALDDLPVSEAEWGRFEKLMKRVFDYHLSRIPLAAQEMFIFFCCGIVEVPTHLRKRWNINDIF